MYGLYMNPEQISAQETEKPLALLYVRVSTSRQADKEASLETQTQTLTETALAEGFRVEVIREEGKSAKDLRRPALKAAIEKLDSGEAVALYATRLDRVSRSVADFAWLIDRSKRMGWRTRILDVGVDTETPSGEFLVMVLAAAAQYERRINGARTKENMAYHKSEGKHMGRAPVLPAEVFEDICLQKAQGSSLNAVARNLNERGVPTALGGKKWYASTVKAVLTSSRIKTQPSPEVLERLGYVA